MNVFRDKAGKSSSERIHRANLRGGQKGKPGKQTRNSTIAESTRKKTEPDDTGRLNAPSTESGSSEGLKRRAQARGLAGGQITQWISRRAVDTNFEAEHFAP